MDIQLRELTENDGTEGLMFLQDIVNEDGIVISPAPKDIDAASYPAWLKAKADGAKGVNMPDGFVPCTTYWIMLGDTVIGLANIKHRLNDFLRKKGGHIGIAIAKAYRRRGCGYQTARLLISKARSEFGIDDILITIDPGNTASRRLFEKLGAKLEDTDEHCHYWIRKGTYNMIVTDRLILRRWESGDTESLYEYASDPDVGPRTGWPPHQSPDESRWVIENVLNGPECYAICLKEDNRAVGTIELKLKDKTELTDRDDECELGYWLGKPLWGKGIMPEAGEALLRRAFTELGMKTVLCTYSEGNHNSKRVQEKLGMRFIRMDKDVDVPMLNEKRTHYVNMITREEWKDRHPGE